MPCENRNIESMRPMLAGLNLPPFDAALWLSLATGTNFDQARQHLEEDHGMQPPKVLDGQEVKALPPAQPRQPGTLNFANDVYYYGSAP